MFDSSRDILNLALTISVVVLTFFISWILWYIVKTLRDIERTIRNVTQVINKLNNLVDFAKEKIGNAAAVLPIILKAGEKMMEYASTYRQKKSEKSSDKNKKKVADVID